MAYDVPESDQHLLAKAWEENIIKGLKHRRTFKKQYDEAHHFTYDGHESVFEEANVTFPTTVPKAWEFQRIFRALIGFKEPNRTVRPRFATPDDPRKPFAKVSRDLLNYQANELKLRQESREWVDEALLGAGVMWLERDPVTRLVGHFAGSILDLSIDPDAETMRDAWWVARRKMMPRWEVADRFGAKMDDLPKGTQSISDMVLSEQEKNDRKNLDDGDRVGKTNDLLEVWELWSKMGVGYRLKDASEDIRANEPQEPENFCHFYVIKGSKKLWELADWPIPLGLDNDWPCTLLYFAKKRRYVWPQGVMGVSLGLQKAIDWMAAMVLTKIRTTTRDFIAVLQGLEEDIQDKIRHGGDLEVLPINATDIGEGKSLRDLIDFLQHPPMNTDIWRVWEMVLDLFEKSSGLYAALYGQSGGTQPRSAEEIKERRQRADLRPEDMREIVEEAHSELARKEMIAMRLLYTPEFVQSILGDRAGEIWGTYREGDLEAMDAQSVGIGRIMREFDFRVEAASTTRPDIHQERENAIMLADRLFQPALNLGDVNSANIIATMLQEAFNVPEDKRVTFQPPPPPEAQPDPTEEIKLQQELVKLEQMKLELEIKRVEAVAKGVEAQKSIREAEQELPGETLAREMVDRAGPREPVAIEDGKPVYAR